jgi:hypothetical protein
MDKGLTGKQKTSIIVLAILVLTGIAVFWMVLEAREEDDESTVNSFAACVAAGNPVMESMPRQCATPEGLTFAETITAEDQTDSDATLLQSEKGVSIVLTAPLSGATIASPLAIQGEVPGSWSFEGSFPVTLTNQDGVVVSLTSATLSGDWMTEELVPFTAEMTFDASAAGTSGSLILQKDNASGLSENDDAVEIPVQF